MSNKNETKTRFSTKEIAKIAILGAIAFVLMAFDFPLPVAPSFYKLDFSEVAVLVGGFAMGPLAGVCIEALKIVLNTLFTGTSTMYIGEVANFIIGCSFVVPACVIYKKNKSKISAVTGLVVGTLVMIVVGVFANFCILLPAYSYFYHLPLETIVSMGQAIFPIVKSTFTFALVCVSLFNLIKGIVVSVITVLLYKHISPILHR